MSHDVAFRLQRLVEVRLAFVAKKLDSGWLTAEGASRLREIAPWVSPESWQFAWEQENLLNEDAVRHDWKPADEATAVVLDQIRARVDRVHFTSRGRALALPAHGPTVLRPARRARAPRSRRVGTRAASRGSPRLSDDDPEPDLAAASAAPAVVVVFELEAAPRVIAAWSTDADDARMTEWLDAHPEYADLLHRAVELSGEAA